MVMIRQQAIRISPFLPDSLVTAAGSQESILVTDGEVGNFPLKSSKREQQPTLGYGPDFDQIVIRTLKSAIL